MKLTKLAGILLVLTTAGAWQASAQAWDTSGNGLLKGTYYFRDINYTVGYQNGALGEAVVLYGTINFAGDGTYTASVSDYDSDNQGRIVGGTLTGGTYSIAASGYGFLSSMLFNGDYIYGLANQAGIFIGSATENVNGYNDLFVMAPLGSPQQTAPTFKGSYTIAGIDLSSGDPSTTVNYTLQINPDGVKNLGTGTLTAYVGQDGSTKYTSSIPSVTYAATNGAMVFTLPISASGLVTGLKFVYISPDGNFIFGGAPNGWDMFVGVRTGSGTPSFGNLYYQAGIDQDESTLAADGFANLDTYYGSLSASGGNTVEHQRISSPFSGTYDYSFGSSYSVGAGGTYASPAMTYTVGQGGQRIGSGIGPYLGINVAIPAPSFSGTGPFLNPTGVVNAASSAPFTAGVAPGELLTLYGSNLADSLVISPGIPFQTSLGNVQVTINGIPAPIYYVAPTQVSVIVPYELNAAIASIQVTTDGNLSNIVSEYTNETSVGVFSVPPGGLGYGAALHQNGALVTPSNPAQIGEAVSVYLTGLGAVSPTIADGAAGPSGTLAQATATISADISGTPATVLYEGLAPQLAGLYQVNLTIPSGVTNGDNTLDIAGPDSYTTEVLISIGSSGAEKAANPLIRDRRVPHIFKAVKPARPRKPIQ